ncbi:MAG TPA: electron transfer flavoprotein subunit beta/FixA family protein [Rhodocyclaceae bacterium]|nr:electron transfer flavoprotein subunit beta/FixA family protein [Rhodocyclaceae bacterium]
MKVLVALKRVIDYNVRVRPRADGLGVETAGVKMSVNPFDENAIEEALRLKEAGKATEIVAVTLGGAAAQEGLRHALAMGVDRVIHGETADELDSLAVAKYLKAVVAAEQPQLVLLGKQAIDDDAGQAAQMLAALLDWPQAVAVSKLTVEGNTITVVREIDGGTETLNIDLPAVISADLRLNDPRFVKLPNLMMAKKKPIGSIDLSGLAAPVSLAVKAVAEPPPRKGGVKLNSVAELVDKLKNEAGVL